MADDELSRSSAGDDDFEETEDDAGIDNEGTLDEEEALDEGDYEDELKGLEEEGEMDIEELRRRYGIPAEGIADASTSFEEEGSSQGETSTSHQQSYSLLQEEDDEAEEEDKDYAPPDPFRKEIRVDADLYQAVIPDVGIPEEAHPISEPLWTPSSSLSDAILDEYLLNITNIRRDIGQTIDERYSQSRDDEDSLCALLRADYDVERAKASFPFPQVNKAVRTVRAGALDWDEEEKEQFERALATHGKNFLLIKNMSPLYYRTIGELVDYYYKWKTTIRYKQYRQRLLQPDEDYRQFTTSILSEGPPPAKKAATHWLEPEHHHHHHQQSHHHHLPQN